MSTHRAFLVLRYNLFRGTASIAREREAFLRVKEARENLGGGGEREEEEARVAYHALITARARLEALSDGVDAQRATRDIYAQQFDLGQRGLLDLLDAENELQRPQQRRHCDVHGDVRRLPRPRSRRRDAGQPGDRPTGAGDQHLPRP